MRSLFIHTLITPLHHQHKCLTNEIWMSNMATLVEDLFGPLCVKADDIIDLRTLV